MPNIFNRTKIFPCTVQFHKYYFTKRSANISDKNNNSTANEKSVNCWIQPDGEVGNGDKNEWEDYVHR